MSLSRGRLRIGAQVKGCDNSTPDVCCPIQQSTSEKKCEEWQQLLFAPHSFDQPRYERFVCAIGGAIPLIGGMLGLHNNDAYPFEYSHVVALGYGTNITSLKFGCGATLISENYLLTAAHCVIDNPLGKPSYVIIGDRILDPQVNNDSWNPYRKVVSIVEHIVHQEYKPPCVYHDIALLRLSTQLLLDRFLLPACISTPLKAPRRNSSVEICGWGIRDVETSSASNVLQGINISTIGQGTCNKIFGDKSDKHVRYPRGLLKSQVCAAGENQHICRSDSGGGLFIRENQCMFHIVGITSLGSLECGLNHPSVYTNVASYQDWIESVVWGREPKSR